MLYRLDYQDEQGDLQDIDKWDSGIPEFGDDRRGGDNSPPIREQTSRDTKTLRQILSPEEHEGERHQ